jgi:hypothetical protein
LLAPQRTDGGITGKANEQGTKLMADAEKLFFMTSKVFTKLLGLFVLLLAFQTAGDGVCLHRICGRAPEDALLLGRDALWSA